MDELVSVVMPTYKRHRDLVKRALDSLLSQTYKNTEIVLVDDNAGAELSEFRKEIEELAGEYPKVVYIRNEKNMGGAGARNEGIAVSHGEYITFLDDDDLYLPEKVEKQLAFMLNRNLDVSFGKLNIYNEEDVLIDVREHDIKNFDCKELLKYHLTVQITGTPTFMVKKSVLTDINGFEVVPMGQEFYLMQKILLGNYKVGYFPECYIKAYRTKAEAISTGKNKISGEKTLFAYKKKYFYMLSFSQKQFVRCRHYAVMAVAYKRNRMFIKAMWSLFVAFCSSPKVAVKEYLQMKKRIRRTEK